MKIIGLTGGIGHGKTTLAGYLEAAAQSALQIETSGLISEIANALRLQPTPAPDDIEAVNHWLAPLPEIIEQHLHAAVPEGAFTLSGDNLQKEGPDIIKLFDYLRLMAEHPDWQHTTIDAANKDQFRPILQWLGGYCVTHVNERIWFDELLRRCQQQAVDLVIISGVRFPADGVAIHEAGGRIIEIMRPNLEAVDLDDITERQRQDVAADVVLLNDGSLKQLQACSNVVYDDLISSKLRGTYHASQY